MKPLAPSIIVLILALWICLPNAGLAQSSQLSYTVNLIWFTLQVTCPSEVMPGDAINVSVHGSPTSGYVYLQNLTATIYYADSSGLHQVATWVLASNPISSYAYYGYYGSVPTGSFSKNFTLIVPNNAPRTSLEALFSESTQYSSYSYYGPVSWSDWVYGDPVFSSYYPPVLYSYYPGPGVSIDQALAPLSYIKATTPEYVALQSQYHNLQQELNQTQRQNQQLQTTITQQSTMINQLNQRLTAANDTAQAFEAATTILLIMTLGLLAFLVYQRRKRWKTKETVNAEPTRLVAEGSESTS